MGRWGKGIYQSDSALDYFSTISDVLEREIAYWFAPEQITETSSWLSAAIIPIEVILLFEEHDIGSNVFLNNEKAVQRWSETYLNIWDKEEWISYKNYYKSVDEPLDNYDYRKQHRSGIVAIFDQLETIAHFWETIEENDRRLVLPPLPPEYHLPYFSRYPGRLVEQLVKDIIYYLSAEMRPDALGFFRVHEDLPVAVDVLGLLCTTYKTDPIVNQKGIRAWRDTTMEIINQTKEDYEIADQSEHYANIMAAFDRLEAAAEKYPPEEW